VKGNVRRVAVFALFCAVVGVISVGVRVEKRLVHLSAKDGSTQWSSVVRSDSVMADSMRRWSSVDGIRARDALELLIVTSPGHVSALDASTGAKRWSFSVPPSAKVAVGEQSVVIHSSENDQYRLTSYDLTDGTQRWTTQTSIEYFATLGISDRPDGLTALWFNPIGPGNVPKNVVEIHVLNSSGESLRVVEAAQPGRNFVVRSWRFGNSLVLDAGVIIWKVDLNAGTVESLFENSTALGANGSQLLLVRNREKLVGFDVPRQADVWETPFADFSRSRTEWKTLDGNIYTQDGNPLAALELRSIAEDGTVETVASLRRDQGEDPQITRDGVVFDPAGKPDVGGLSGNKVTWTRYVDGYSLVHERGVTFLVEQPRWRFWFGRP
jgi:hypothetical protein